jgi:hypothetical protein
MQLKIYETLVYKLQAKTIYRLHWDMFHRLFGFKS